MPNLPDYSTAAEKKKFAEQMLELFKQDRRVGKFIDDQNEMTFPADDKFEALKEKETDTLDPGKGMDGFFQQSKELFQNLQKLASCEENQVDKLWSKVEIDLFGMDETMVWKTALDNYTIEYGFRMADTPAGQFCSGLQEVIQNVYDEIDYFTVEQKQQKKLDKEEQKLDSLNRSIEEKENELADGFKELNMNIDRLQPELEQVELELKNAQDDMEKLKTGKDLEEMNQEYIENLEKYEATDKEYSQLKDNLMKGEVFYSLEEKAEEALRSRRDYIQYEAQMNKDFPNWESTITGCELNEKTINDCDAAIKKLKEGSSGPEIKAFIQDWNDRADVEIALDTMEELKQDLDFNVWEMTKIQKESPDELADKYDQKQIQNLKDYQNAKEMLISHAVKNNLAAEDKLRKDFEEMENDDDIDPCEEVLKDDSIYVSTKDTLDERLNERKRNQDVQRYSEIADEKDEARENLEKYGGDREKIREAKAELEKKEAKWKENQKKYEDTIIGMGAKAGVELRRDSREVNPLYNGNEVSNIREKNKNNIQKAQNLKERRIQEKQALQDSKDNYEKHLNDEEKKPEIQNKINQLEERYEKLKNAENKVNEVTGLIEQKNNEKALAALEGTKAKNNGRKQQYERYFNENKKYLKAPDENKDSEPYRQMMNQMKEVQEMLCGDKAGDKAKAIELLQQKAQAYLDAKDKQWRPFPSQQRIDRLQGARSLLEFCTNVQRQLNADGIQAAPEKQKANIITGKDAAKNELTQAMERKVGKIEKQNKLNNQHKNPQVTVQKKKEQSVLGGS